MLANPLLDNSHKLVLHDWAYNTTYFFNNSFLLLQIETFAIYNFKKIWEVLILINMMK